VHVLVENDLQAPRNMRAVGFRPQGHPVVRAIGRRIVLGRDHHERAPRSIHSSFQCASGILFSTKFLPQLVFSLEKRMSERSMSEA
jgi:hypothetical protein